MLMQDLEMLKAQGTQVSEERLAILQRRNSTFSINHHAVLGVSCRASIAEIKAAHRLGTNAAHCMSALAMPAAPD